MLQWGPPLGRERDIPQLVTDTVAAWASMGPATGAGKGRVLETLYDKKKEKLQWGPPLGRERDLVRDNKRLDVVKLQWGPPLGRERDLNSTRSDRTKAVFRFNGARHWGGKGTRHSGRSGGGRCRRFNGARHWGGKGTCPTAFLPLGRALLQWGPPLGRERDLYSPSDSTEIARQLQWGPPLGRERDVAIRRDAELREEGLQWGPPLGRERDPRTPSTNAQRCSQLQWGPPLGRERDHVDR